MSNVRASNPSFPPNPRLWSRDLTDEDQDFAQADAPNYVAGMTILCYDCHDNQRPGDVDDDPDPAAWTTSIHAGQPQDPQDIAFNDWPGARGSGGTGYFELDDGSDPLTGSPPTDGSPTGGHFWRSVPNPGDTPRYERGDKLGCDLCHDVHNRVTGSNEVFFRTSTTDGSGNWGAVVLGNNRNSSTNTRAHSGETPSSSNSGRDMCAACHSYSDSGGTGVPSDPVAMWGVTLPKPPSTIPQHASGSIIACTDCHAHNRISVSCSNCHGNPPLVDSASAGGFFDPDSRPQAESYAGGAGAHRRHLDALGPSVFDCEICHGPSAGSAAWHNSGGGAVLQGNVDIMGESAFWDPAGALATGYRGAASPEAVPPGYDFAARGGNDGASGGRCYGLACHGGPPDTAEALNWTDDMVDETTGAPVTLDICRWCHDASPATIDGGTIIAPNVMGNGSTFGAEVNGHGLPAAMSYDRDAAGDALGSAGAGKDCTICHDARYQVNPSPPPGNVPVKAHFDGSFDSAEKRLRSTINGQGTAGPDGACLACHQNTGPEAGSQVSTHGNSGAGGYGKIEPAAFTRQCRQCHEPHGLNWNGSGRNLSMVGRWLDNTTGGNRSGTPDAGEAAVVDTNNSLDFSAADRPVVFTATSGNGSWDDGLDDGLHESVCVVCHDDLVNNHNEFSSPELLGTGHNPVGTNCGPCHGHDYDSAAATADGFMPRGCSGCHGNSAANTIWPDGPGTVKTAYPDRLGRHARHVEEVVSRLNATPPASGGWSDLPRTLLTMSQGDQQRVCAYCHNDPSGIGGSGHYPEGYTKDDAPADVGSFNPLWDTTNPPSVADADSLYTPATYSGDTYSGGSTCAAVDCHNNKDTTPLTFGWYDSAAADCTMCHTVGGSGEADPSSGLHAIVNTGTVMEHSDNLDDGSGNSGCRECHANAGVPPGTHRDGTTEIDDVANTDRFIDRTNLTWSDGAANSGTCSGTGLAGPACHSDDGTWSRLWSTAADSTSSTVGDARCAVCHGDNSSGWNSGVVTHAANIFADDNHTDGTVCGSCHGIGSTSGTSTYAWAANHESGAIMMNGPDATPGPRLGAEYDDSTGGCDAACHDNTLTFAATSAVFGVEYGSFGGCYDCHDQTGPGPNVMGNGNLPSGNGGTPKPFDDGDWGYTVNGHGINGTANNTPSAMDGSGDYFCAACHDLTDPAGTHRDGTLNSAETGSNTNANTAHLVAGFIDPLPSNDYDVQLQLDYQCDNQCHDPIPFWPAPHGHGSSTTAHPSDPDIRVVEFGRANTPAFDIGNGEAIVYPIDVDMSTNANGGPYPGDTDYAPCVSCHNPHGTATVEPQRSTNRMLRGVWLSANDFCNVCH